MRISSRKSTELTRPHYDCNLTGQEISEKHCGRCGHQLKEGEYCQKLREMNQRAERERLNLPSEKRIARAVDSERTLGMFLSEEYREKWR